MSRRDALSAGSRIALMIALLAAPAALHAQTAVTPDVGNPFALGTTAVQSGSTITIDGGTRAGANLFHSFTRFNLGVGATARWTATDPGGVANVINRVTGGEASRIDGTLDSTALPNAAFYFVNPAGIVFGAGAAVNVPGAAHFSTGSHLDFADGGRFTVAAPDGSTLSVAAPEAWGFLGGQGDITITGVSAGFAPVAPLSFSAADVTFTNANFSVGGLDVTAVGAASASVQLSDPLNGLYAGEIRLSDSVLNAANADAPVGAFRLGAGHIDFDRARLVSDTVGGAAGADIRLDAGSIRIGRDSLLVTSSRGAGRGGAVDVTAGDLVLDGTGSTTFTAGVSSVATASGAAGPINLTADSFLAQGNAFIGSSVGGSADAGDIQVTASNLVVNSAILNTATLPGSTGQGSSIRLNADTFDLGAANMTTQAFGSGRAGDVILEGGSLIMSGGSLGSTPGGTADSGNLTINLTGRLETDGAFLGVSTFSDSAVAAGVITIRSSEMIMRQSSFFTQSSGQGAPGRVLIETGDVGFDEVFYIGDAKDGVGDLPGLFRLTATGDIFMRDAFLTSNANGLANGGVIEILGRNIDLVSSIIQSEASAASFGDAGSVLVAATGDLNLSASFISSSTDGDGRAGDVRAQASAIKLEFGSALRSDAFRNSTGNAGQVSVSAGSLLVHEGSVISSETLLGAVGDAGGVTVDSGRLTLATAGLISSTTRGPGDGGTVVIRADEITLAGEQQQFTSIRAETLGDGRGGSIAVAAKRLTLDGGGLISTVSEFDADAGSISLDVGELLVLNGSGIATISFGAGKSGDIDIVADKLEVRSDERFLPSYISSAGVFGGGGDIRLDVTSLVVDYSQISSDSTNDGDAGDIAIKADSIALRTLGQISSSTQGFGNAGSISIDSKSVEMDDATIILSAATSLSSGGNAGSVSVVADNLIIGEDASITTSTLSTGDAGVVDIRAKDIQLDGGFISSSAEIGSTGRARDVRITADNLAVVNGGSIDTFSANPNSAGTIDIRSGTLLIDGLGSVITSENLAGDPVFTDPGPGGDAGTIRIAADNVTISNGGRISTNAFAGAAGDINIAIPRPGLLVLEGAEFPGIIQTSSGAGTGGRIIISNPLAIISNGSRILALGELRGANVVIQSRYFVESTDRLNTVAVDGEFQIQTGLYDVSSGVVSRDLSVLDASRVLRGQCPAARSTGSVSQLITRPVGPYVREAAPESPRAPQVSAPAAGACP